MNNEGVPIKSTLDNPTTVQYSGLLNNLVDQVIEIKSVFAYLSQIDIMKLFSYFFGPSIARKRQIWEPSKILNSAHAPEHASGGKSPKRENLQNLVNFCRFLEEILESF